MEQTATLLYGEDDAFQTVVLSFKKSTIGLVICLPKEKTFKGIAPELGAEKFEIVLEGLSSQMVHLQLPKFTIKELSNMNSLLSQLGLSIAFSREADFSKIDGKHDLFLSKALHAALIAVDENGVVAAAASAASMNVKSMPNQKPPAEFNADHPFVFALIDLQTKTPLFLGELANPQ
jgi:serpin B